MVYHAQCVVRGADRALVIVDMPFGPVQQGPASGLDAAVRIMKETGASGVKVEGGGARVETVRRIVEADVPVMGHLGLTPQSIHEYGSYRVRARDDDEAARLREDARRLEAAGCFALVLEMIPADLARAVAEDLTIPAIGIGAGAGTDGQVLVMHDALGLTTDSTPGFVRAYADLGEATTEAVERYVDDVRTGSFPSDEESY
jgi:3-methyl-2-oxobutanoate hydroxymethyltransferase